ncbi:MAG: hypothetical protein Fur0046_10470 [Cyanobacteria bacterium J069]
MNVSPISIQIELSHLFSVIKDGSIILGVIIALANYRGQKRQGAIRNSLDALDLFWKEVTSEDLELWQDVYFSAYEGAGAKQGRFVVHLKDGSIEQVPLTNLFVQEGTGLYIADARLQIDDETEFQDLTFGSVRKIAEQLNWICYQIRYGNVDLEIICNDRLS